MKIYLKPKSSSYWTLDEDAKVSTINQIIGNVLKPQDDTLIYAGVFPTFDSNSQSLFIASSFGGLIYDLKSDAKI